MPTAYAGTTTNKRVGMLSSAETPAYSRSASSIIINHQCQFAVVCHVPSCLFANPHLGILAGGDSHSYFINHINSMCDSLGLTGVIGQITMNLRVLEYRQQ